MRNFKLKIVALLFAIGFWFFVLSQQKFLLTMEVPLVVSRVPEVLAIVSTPPKMISIQVSGYVLDLLRVRADKDGISVVVNAQDVEQGWSHFTISQENFYAPDHPNVQYVEGDRIRSLDVEFDTKVVRKIPVRLQADGKQENKNFELQKRKTAGTFRTADRICGLGCVSISYAGT